MPALNPAFPSIPKLPLDPTFPSWGVRERLLHLRHLAEHLRQCKADLQMADWFGPSSANACGTAACMAGYATADPTFQALGLTAADLVSYIVPEYNGRKGYGGLEALFGSMSYFIFGSRSYLAYPITLDNVIDHIDLAIAQAAADPTFDLAPLP